MKNFILVLVLSGVTLLFMGCNRPKLLVATDPTWPPMEMIEEGRLVGFDIDLMKMIGEKAGFDVEFTNVGWKELLTGLQNSVYDAAIADLGITEERKALVDFSVAYYNGGQVLLMRVEDNGITNIRGMEGKRLGSLIDTIGALEIQKMPNVTFQGYSDIQLAVEALIKGDIDGVVCGLSTAGHILYEDKQNRVKIVGEPFTYEFAAIAVRKGDKRTLDLINNGLKSLLYEKLVDKLEKKWFYEAR